MESAIEVENLGKRYLLGHLSRRVDDTLRDRLASVGKQTIQRIRHPFLSSAADEVEEFWALRNVSFSVRPGERLGVIGRNGAGKSTLLKILSRITEPTTGRFKTNGRVSSLLEVGTGFHPELSGRENIFLNGAILGMSRGDIKKKFDEIVAFAEIEKFLDTPVKRYSSGMYVRLAFSVAAHLEPEILIVDEVLAVGDGAFQKKCLGKMEDVGKEGRTVIFVSHNLSAVRSLCNRGIWLEGGVAKMDDVVDKTADEYLKAGLAGLQELHSSHFSLLRLEKNVMRCDDKMAIEMNIRPEVEPLDEIRIGLYSAQGDRLSTMSTKKGWKGAKSVVCETSPIRLIPGDYRLNVVSHSGKTEKTESLDHALTFQVVAHAEEGLDSLSAAYGAMLLRSEWKTL